MRVPASSATPGRAIVLRSARSVCPVAAHIVTPDSDRGNGGSVVMDDVMVMVMVMVMMVMVSPWSWGGDEECCVRDGVKHSSSNGDGRIST